MLRIRAHDQRKSCETKLTVFPMSKEPGESDPLTEQVITSLEPRHRRTAAQPSCLECSLRRSQRYPVHARAHARTFLSERTWNR